MGCIYMILNMENHFGEIGKYYFYTSDILFLRKTVPKGGEGGSTKREERGNVMGH